MAALIILTFAAVGVFQIPRLVREKRKKEMVYFCLLSLVGFTLLMLFNAGVKIPGPIKMVMGFLDRIGLHY